LPERVNEGIGDRCALDLDLLRRFGRTVQVRASGCGQLDICTSAFSLSDKGEAETSMLRFREPDGVVNDV
jgi:hypothetical protein